MSKFVDVSKEIQEVAKQYKEIDPQIEAIFLDSFATFIGITKELSSGVYGDITDSKIKLSVFENLFDIDVSAEVLKITEAVLKERAENDSEDCDVANADADLLASIRSNFDEFLKD